MEDEALLSKETAHAGELPSETDTLVPIMPTGQDVFRWSIKQIACPKREIQKVQTILSGVYITVISFVTWLSWDNYLEHPYSALYVNLALVGIYTYTTLLCVRQKTIYNYTIKTDGASLEYYLHHPELTTDLFETASIIVILVFLFAAIYMGSLIFLLGPAAGMLAAAFHLMNWENPVHNECSLPWHQYYFVTIDRKRLMVITHHTDLTVGFDMRFPSEAMIEKYLNFLKATLPPTAKFIEKEWEW